MTADAPRRGRPRQSQADTEAARARIVAATAEVFAERGSRGLSVALIIERAGIARPTFYRYFANAEDPLQAVLDTSDHALVDGLQAALDGAEDEVQMVIAGIDAYLGWARASRPGAAAAVHRAARPGLAGVAAPRAHARPMLRDRLTDRFVRLGRTPPPAEDIDVLLNTFEYVGFRVALGRPASPPISTGPAARWRGPPSPCSAPRTTSTAPSPSRACCAPTDDARPRLGPAGRGDVTDLRATSDARAADWLVERVGRHDIGVQAVPGFPAHARILHPLLADHADVAPELLWRMGCGGFEARAAADPLVATPSIRLHGELVDRTAC